MFKVGDVVKVTLTTLYFNAGDTGVVVEQDSINSIVVRFFDGKKFGFWINTKFLEPVNKYGEV
jgi:hypothetical protein